MEEIRKLLDTADQKLARDDLDGAERDYRRALDLAEKKRQKELIDRAYKGCTTVQQRRIVPAMNGGADKAIAELKLQYAKASGEERKLLLLKQLLNARVDKIDDRPSTELYGELLNELRRRLLRQSRDAAEQGDQIVAALPSPVTEEERARAVERYYQAIQIVQGSSLRASSFSPADEASVQQVQADLNNDAVQQAIASYSGKRDAIPPIGAMAQALEASAQGGVTPAGGTLSARDDTARRAEELRAQAEARLRRPTTANYKEALNLLQQAIGLSSLNSELQARLRLRLGDVQADYETFRRKFGELITARQLDRVEEELVSLRSLINDGQTLGPDGEDLAEKLAKLSDNLRAQLLRVAAEQAALADRQLIDGRDYLESGSLRSAEERFASATRLLRGESLGVQGAATNSERGVAIQGLRSDLQKHPDIRTSVADFEARREEVQRTIALVERCTPLYREAERLFNLGQYREALAQVGQLRALIGDRMSSQLVSTLELRTRDARAAQLVAELQVLVERAKTALARDDLPGVEAAAQQALLLDPQFKSAEVDALRANVTNKLDEMRRREQAVMGQLAEVRRLISADALDQAEALGRQVVLARPDNGAARKLLDEILYTRIESVLRKVESGNDGVAVSALQAFQAELGTVRGLVEELGDPALRRRLGERFEEAAGGLTRRIEQLRTASTRTQRFGEALAEAERFVKLEQFDEAARWLEEARKHAQGQEARHVRVEAELRASWASYLRRKLRQALDSTPPQLDAALSCAEELQQRGLGDQQSAELARRARQLRARADGLSALERGEFAQAAQHFGAADLDNPETLQLLREARARELDRLAGYEQWAEVIALLRELGSGDDARPELMRRSRGELALRRAADQLREKQFDACERALDEAEQQQLSQITQRSKAIRTELARAREIYRRVDQQVDEARAGLRRFEASQNRDELLNAITGLDTALADVELQPGDRQREQIQSLRDDYQRRYQSVITSERQRLLQRGNEQLKADQAADALRSFNAVLKIMPGGDDPEAREGVERVSRRLVELRAELVEQTRELLNLGRGGQRGVRPNALRQQIEQIEALRRVEPDVIDVPLNTHLAYLQDAERLCLQADEALNSARHRWVDLRAAALGGGPNDTKEIEGDIERGVGIFSRKTYIHIELDRTSIESLPARFSRDLVDLGEATRAQAEVRRQIEHELRSSDDLLLAYERLRTVEERLLQTTLRLIDHDRVASLTRPATYDERYPRQSEILRRLRDQVEQLRHSELSLPSLSQLRETLARRTQLEELLRRLDPDMRFKA